MMVNRSASLVPVALFLALAAGSAQARPASSGYYAEAGIGATGFIGDKAVYTEAGPAVDIRTGYDLFPWLSLGVHLGASSHEAAVPPPPVGEYFQLYSAAGEIRLQYRHGRFGFFIDGSVGATMISSNILAKVEVLEPSEDTTLSYGGGAGVEYQLLNRHYALGLAGQWTMLPDFDSLSHVGGRAYLRYTY
jgi:hypothetical protein